ncbi:MAG: ShlB/FhaC/HecB family hemolysin secretion/activation protein [Gammaproteobacteria bacterium]|nr:MAG: ShlB/FhaC/HecB family hemolysin secretion/activation protein [Gammaproteobacteria bacterium]
MRKHWLWAMALLAPLSWAQTAPPLSGRIFESQKPVEAPKPPESRGPVITIPEVHEQAAASGGMTFLLAGVRFEGNTVIPSAELDALLAPMIGRDVALADLQSMASAIAAYYSAKGYLLVQAVLPPQKVSDGLVTFRVIEGFVDRVQVLESSAIVGDEQALAYFTAVQNQAPLSRESLERPLLLLNRLEGISAQASLGPGEAPGSSTVGVVLGGEQRRTGQFYADNFGSASTGEARVGMEWSYPGLAGRADWLRVSLLTSEGSGIESGGLGYSLPLGTDGLSLDVDIEHMTYSLGGPFASLDAYGEANDGSIRLSYPLELTAHGSTEVWSSYRYRELRDVLDAVGDTNRRNIHRMDLGVTRSGFDALGGWNYAMFSYAAGELDLETASAKAGDVYGQEGFFSKANLLLTRQQRLTGSLGLNLFLQGQYAWQNLDSGEKFSLGGPYSVRAYPVSELSGDHGWLAQWAVQWYANEQVTLSLFSDRGWVRFNADELRGNPWTEQYLRSTGIGFDWQGPYGFEFHASWAWSGSHESASDKGNTDGRFYGVVRKRF